MRKRLRVKYQLFLTDYTENWIFSTDLWKKAHVWSFVKIGPVGAELFHVERGTDGQMTKLIVAFRNFANAPENGKVVDSSRLYRWPNIYRRIFFFLPFNNITIFSVTVNMIIISVYSP
jgi:hypothetical protein